MGDIKVYHDDHRFNRMMSNLHLAIAVIFFSLVMQFDWWYLLMGGAYFLFVGFLYSRLTRQSREILKFARGLNL